MITVSVVLPAYNGEGCVDEAIKSIYRQTAPPYEVIVVDDGSTDGTPGLLRELSATYPLTVVTQPNGGEASARNTGVSAAQGDLIAFLDQDDIWHPEMLERQRAQFTRDPSLGMSFTATQQVGPAARAARPVEHWDPGRALPRLLKGCEIETASAVVVRRDLLHEFEQVEPYGSDWLMWLELASRGVRIGHLPEQLVDYYRHEESTTARSHPDGRGLPGCWVIPRFFERNPDVPDRRRWRAHWHLLAAEHGDGRLNLLKAAAIQPPSVRPGWLRLAVKGHAAWN